ncbi:MAG TPA: ABC transporter permease [Geminicoccaceae bacterium]|nr:ABC transporter permease [Geminicoccus sp.]HMU51497.1 ABC transporter permease [Geminicoccaceae bacterium]
MATLVETIDTVPRGEGTLARFGRSRSAVVGVVLIGLFVLMALTAPIVAPYDPLANDWLALRQAPSWAHPMGTDDLGRDVLSRVIWGAQTSLLAGVLSVLLALAIGMPFGMAAGYLGGIADLVISRITDALLACPQLMLAIALAIFMGASLLNATIAIGLSTVPVFVRLARGQTMQVKAEPYIESARAVGNSGWRIVALHILPNLAAPLIVQCTLSIAIAIIAEAGLSFLGLGRQPPAPSWGTMLTVGRNYISNAPWLSIWPGLCICLAVLGFNLVGDGLRQALDPRRR